MLGATFQFANQSEESELGRCRQVSWIVYLLSIFQIVFDLIIFTKELSKSEILPLITTPVYITGSYLPSCHDKQGKVCNLLNNIIGQVVNLLV